MPTGYVKLIRDYGLAAELKLTKRQRERIGDIEYQELVHLYRTSRIPSEPKAFEAFTKELRSKAETQLRNTNAEIEAVLSPKQLKRLRQIGFQLHTLKYTNLSAAFSYFGKEIDPDRADSISRDLAQAKIAVRGLRFHFERVYAKQALAGVIGKETYRELVGTPRNPPISLGPIILRHLKPDELPNATKKKEDVAVSRHLLNMDPAKFESGKWIMELRFLKHMIDNEQKELQLSDEQIAKLTALKAVPDRETYEYSYVVAKTGVTKPNFDNEEITRQTIGASFKARAAHRELVVKHQADVAKILTKEQRVMVQQRELSNHCATGSIRNTVRVLQFYGVKLNAAQSEKLKVAYLDIPMSAQSRVNELRIAVALDLLAKQFDAKEIQKMLGDPFHLLLDDDFRRGGYGARRGRRAARDR